MDYKKKLSSVYEYIKGFDYYFLAIPLCIAIFLWIIGAFTGMWPGDSNSYNSFALQADSWLNGRLDLGMDYEWLELAIFDGKYFVSFPPFPSYILLPFAVFCGANTPDNIINPIATVIGAIYAYKLCLKVLGNEKNSLAFLFTMILYLGSNTMFFIANGWVWFMAQNFSFTLTIMAVYYAYKACPGWSLFFWACAVGCRPFQILYFPVLLILMISTWKKNEHDFKKCITILKPSQKKKTWDNRGIYRSSFFVENGTYYIYYSGIGYPKGPKSSQGVGLTYGPSVKNIHGYDV